MATDKIPVIYKIINLINDKIYIGSTNDFNLRKYSHLNKLRKNKHYNKKLQNSWNKYGENKIIFEIIEHTTKEKLMELEQYYLDFFKSYDIGYNISKTAIQSTFGIKHINNYEPWNKGKKGVQIAWNKGKTPSEETIKKQSQAKTGNKHFNYGKHLSDGTKHKISISQKGENGNNYGKPTNRKKVYQFDLDNNFIREYDFLMEVNNYGFDFKKVSDVALGKRKTHKNYKWSYILNNE